MRADPDGTARLVPCPECGAKAGENCKSYPGSGAYADIVHRERMQAPAAQQPNTNPQVGNRSAAPPVTTTEARHG